MYPRKAVQRIAISNTRPAYIELPVYSTAYVGMEEQEDIIAPIDILIYPNPASDVLEVYLSQFTDYSIIVSNISGQQIFKTKISDDRLEINVKKYPAGMYFIEAEDVKTGEKKVQKFSVVR